MVFAFIYCPCIHESSYGVISIHHSRYGAEKALNEHRENALSEFNLLWENDEIRTFVFGEGEDWAIKEMEILP